MSFGKRVETIQAEAAPPAAPPLYTSDDLIQDLDDFWDFNKRAPESADEFQRWLEDPDNFEGMTREKFRAGLEEIGRGSRKGGGIDYKKGAGRFLATVEEVTDDLFDDFNEAECEAFTYNKRGRLVLALKGEATKGLETASDYLQACIDEKDKAAEIKEAMEKRQHATRFLDYGDLQERFTACANLCRIRLKSGASSPHHELSIMYDMRAFLRFAETTPEVEYTDLKRFNDMRERTGVAVFASDRDNNPYAPDEDKLRLLREITDLLPEDSSEHLSEIKSASELLAYAVKAMRQNFQNEFDAEPPRLEAEDDTESEE